MKDTYIPKKVPRIEVREKLHGHTTIDLFNVKTKKYERVEHDNMFTEGGISEYIRNLSVSAGVMGFQWSGSGYVALPKWWNAWRTVLGGILLFDTALPTTAKYMPAGTTMVANGAFGTSNAGLPVELGSYNSVESVETNDSVSMVYDWGTAQGNGEIASVSLTTEVGGLIGYGNPSKEYKTDLPVPNCGNTSPASFYVHAGMFNTAQSNGSASIYSNAYKIENELVWAKIEDNSTGSYKNSTLYVGQGASKVTFKSIFRNIDTIDIFTPMSKELSLNAFNAWAVNSIEFTLPSVLSSNYRVYADHHNTNCFWLFPDSRINANASCTAYKLNLSDETVTAYTFTNNTGQQLYFDNGYGRLVIVGDVYIIATTYNNEIYRINIENSVAERVTAPGDWNDTLKPAGIAPGLYSIPTRANVIYDAVLNRILPCNGTNPFASYAFSRSHDLLFNDYAYLFNHPLRLMTINNLDYPVTKTADKTMKVTYTITRAN